MTELTDLELCKRISEIGGVKVSQGQHGSGPVYLWDYERQEVYNPLINNAQIFDLIIKYKVDIVHGRRLSVVKIYDDPEDDPISEICFYHEDTGYTRPILIAIVEANK